MLPEINLFLGGAILALFITLVTSALQIGGVINVNAARLLLTAAWVIAVLGVCGSMQNAPAKHLAIAAAVVGLPLFAALLALERWMSRTVSAKDVARKPTDEIKPGPKPLPNLQFVRAGVEHITLDGDIPRKSRSGSAYSHVALVAVFEAEFADTELMATVEFNDCGNTHIDRACWLYERSHVANLKRGTRKELLIGYKQNNGFVCVENYYDRDRSIKIKLLRGDELIAVVRVLSMKPPIAAQTHRFKITVEPVFSIQKIDDDRETSSEANRLSRAQIDLLDMIDTGKGSFSPGDFYSEANYVDSVRKFQKQANELVRLEAQGYIHRLLISKESIEGQLYIDHVSIVQGLTADGHDALKMR